MILPTKHISEEQALLGVGAVVLKEITRPQTVTSLWEKVRSHQTVGTFERFVLALDMLFLLELVKLESGMIERTNL